MYECFHCGARAVAWDCDYSMEELGYDGNGIVQMLHCTNCGAEIEYMICFDREENGKGGND